MFIWTYSNFEMSGTYSFSLIPGGRITMFLLGNLSIDELNSRIEKLESEASHDTEIVDAYNLLSEKLRYNQVDLKRSLEAAEKAHKFAREIVYLEGEAYALAQVGISLLYLERFKDARKKLELSIARFQQQQDQAGLVFAQNGLARLMIDCGEFLEASELIKDAYKNAVETKNYKEKLIVFDNISRLCFFFAEYDLALEFQEEALSIRNSHLNYGRFYNHIGLLQFMKGENDKSLKSFKKAIKESDNTQDHYAIAKIYSNFAIGYKRIGDEDKSLLNLQKSIDLMREIGLEECAMRSLDDLIDVHLEAEDYSGVTEHIEKLLAITKKAGNDYLFNETKMKSALVTHKLGDTEKAISELNKLWKKLIRFGNPELQYRSKLRFVEIYEDENDSSSALQYFHDHQEYREKFLVIRMAVFQKISDIREDLIRRSSEAEADGENETIVTYDDLAKQDGVVEYSFSGTDDLRDEVTRLKNLLPVCATCRDLLDKPDYLSKIEQRFSANGDRYSNVSCIQCDQGISFITAAFPDLDIRI